LSVPAQPQDSIAQSSGFERNEGADSANIDHTPVVLAETAARITAAPPTTTGVPFQFVRPRVLAAPMAASNPAIEASRPLIRRHFTIRNYDELQQRCLELGAVDYLVEGLLPARSVGIVVGDSGLGKSPLLYQAGICIAAGVPFLGYPVRRGPVLYLDFENGLQDSLSMMRQLSRHVGLEAPPADFDVWNFNDCSPSFGTEGHTVFDIFKFSRPTLIIIDSLSAYQPEIEEKNSIATGVYKALRGVIRDFGTTVLGVHHIRKPSTKPSESPAPLEDSDIRQWFLQTRGPRSLINASDVRLAVDVPGTSVGIRNAHPAARSQIALVLRGFGRVHGEIGPVYIARAFDDEGEPVGYRRMAGIELLFNERQEETLSQLPVRLPSGRRCVLMIAGIKPQPTFWESV
jgi:AAA domain